MLKKYLVNSYMHATSLFRQEPAYVRQVDHLGDVLLHRFDNVGWQRHRRGSGLLERLSTRTMKLESGAGHQRASGSRAKTRQAMKS